MEGALLQDWVTLQGQTGSVKPITQSEPFWLDLKQFRDVVVWMEVQQAGAPLDAGINTLISYQVAPARDEALFTPSAGPFVMSQGVTVTQMLATFSPLGRFLRWSLSPSAATVNGPWEATFRLFVALNRPGSARASKPMTTSPRS